VGGKINKAIVCFAIVLLFLMPTAGFAQLASNSDWPMIDVTRRSVEEIAATILNLLSDTKRIDK
jgi:hypothetical protein